MTTGELLLPRLLGSSCSGAALPKAAIEASLHLLTRPVGLLGADSLELALARAG
jgi:hypothetical protein